MLDPSVQAYMEMSEDELNARLGAALLGGGRGFSASDKERFRRQGAKWFTNHLGEIQEKICTSERVKPFYAGDGADRITDAAALVDAVATIADHPIPSIIAALSVKYGLKGLCRGYE